MDNDSPARTGEPLALQSNDLLGQASEALQPIAYLYHDADDARQANSTWHSTLLVLASERRPTARNETSLVTLEEAQQMVAAERERWQRIATNAQAVTTESEDKLDYFEVPSHLMAALALALDEGPNAALTGAKRPEENDR